MTSIDLENIRLELANVMRNGNVLSLSVRGATTQTDTLTASAGSTVTLTKTQVRNIRSLTINSVSKVYIRDYIFDGTTGIVTFGSAFAGGETVVVQYDYSSAGSEKVYPDMPREDLTLKSFPRVGIEVTNMSTNPFGLGGTSQITDALITVMVWMNVNKESTVGGGLGGTSDLSNVINLIRSTLRSNAKSLYTIPYIYPMDLSPITRSINNKIIQQTLNFNGRFVVEIN